MRFESWLYSIPLRVRSLFRRNVVERELDEELQFHLEQKAQHYVAAGLGAEEARRNALRDIDGLELRKEECRDARRVSRLEDFEARARQCRGVHCAELPRHPGRLR